MLQPLNGSFTGTGGGDSAAFSGKFNFSLWGSFTATVVLERSFDGGLNWLPLTYVDGTPLEWAGPVSTTLEEPENGVRYRARCTAYSGGPVNWRLSR